MKKGGSFQKERFSFFSVVNGGGFHPRTPSPPRAYATGAGIHITSLTENGKEGGLSLRMSAYESLKPSG